MKKGFLSARQRRALTALASGSTVFDAAEAVGVAQKTIYVWLKQPAFREALTTAGDDALAEVSRRITGLATKALAALEDILDDGEASDASRIRAARVVLATMLHVRDQHTTEQRLQALEERLNGNENSPGPA